MSGHANLTPVSHIKECGWQNPKKIGFKTVAWRQGNTFSLRLHGNQVVFWDSMNNQLMVSTAGYRTGITRQRINHGLAEIGLELSTTDIKGQWRVMCPNHQAFTIFERDVTLKRLKDGSWVRLCHNPVEWQTKITAINREGR